MRVDVYTDGGVIVQNPSPYGFTWAWRIIGPEGEEVATGMGYETTPFHGYSQVTNNQAEAWALLDAMDNLLPEWSGRIFSDSEITLGRFFHGWKMTGLPHLMTTRIAFLLRRLDLKKWQPILLSGHPTRAQLATGIGKEGRPVSIHNVWCDEWCREMGERWKKITNYQPEKKRESR